VWVDENGSDVLTVSGNANVSGDLVVDTDTLKVDASTGRIGIGTTDPLYKLDVHGTSNVGALTATSLSGDGSGLTSLNADKITSGTINNQRLNAASTTGAGIVQLSDSTNGSSTTTAATESAVKAAYDRNSWGSGSFSGALTVGGDLIVSGTTTTVDTTNLTIKDAIVELGKDNTTGTTDLGIIMRRPGSNVGIIYDRSASKLEIGHTLQGGSEDTITMDTSNALVVNVNGSLAATSLSGNGSGLTSLNAGNISSGKIDNAHLNAASTTGAGIVQLSTITNGSSTTKAATESAVKAAYDRSSWGSGTFSDVLKLEGGTSTGDASVEDANKTNTYIRFGEAGTGSDWAYLRQIGGNNTIKLALDFHDDDEARFEIRKVNSSSGTGVGEVATTVFSVDDGALTATTGTFSGDLTVGTSNLRVDTTTGNVGIGTASPETALELHKSYGDDSLNSTAEIKFSTNNGNVAWDVGSIRGGIKLNAGGTSNYPGGLVFATKSPGGNTNDLTDKMVIDANGNVGIGTDSPGYKLDVNGTVNTGALTATSLSVAADTNNTGIIGRAKVGNVGYADHAGFAHYDRASTGNYALLQGPTGDTFINASTGKGLYFRENNADKMVLTGGNLGIGTSVPLEFLHVQYPNPTYGSTVTQHSNVVISSGSEFSDAGLFFRTPFNTTSPPKCALIASGGSFSGYNGQLDICFDTTNNNDAAYRAKPSNAKVTFKASGNVGIGTSSPAYKLDVHGTSNVGALTATTATVPNDGDFVMGGKPLKPAGGLHWDRVNSRLGVGTTSPGYTLDVNGTVKTGALTATSGTFSGVGRFTTNGGSLQLVGTDHTYLEYYPDGTSAGRKAYVGYGASTDDNFTISNSAGSGHIILSGGNVGIGTASPGAKLHVNGAITSDHYACFETNLLYYEQSDYLEWKTSDNYISFNSGITLANATDIELGVPGIYLALVKLNSDSAETSKVIQIKAQYYNDSSWVTDISNGELGGDYNGQTEIMTQHMLRATTYTRWRFFIGHNFTTNSNRFAVASSPWSRIMIAKIA